MSDSNKVSVSYVAESSYKTTPGSPTLIEVPFTSESLKQNTSTVNSKVIRSDRNVNEIIRVDVSAGGDVGYELMFGAATTPGSWVDDWQKAALMASSWSAVQTNSGTFSTSGSTITGTGVATGITAGKMIRLKNGSTLLGYFLVTASVVGTLTVTPTPPALTGSGDEEVESCPLVSNGTTLTSFTIEKAFTDKTKFAKYLGSCIDRMTLSASARSVIDGSFSFLAASETSSNSTVGSGSNTAYPTNKVLNTVDNLYGIVVNGTAISATGFSLSLNNNLGGQEIMGTLGLNSVRSGSCMVDGTLDVYFEDATLIDLYLNFTEVPLLVFLKDASDNAFGITLPAVKFTDGDRLAGGMDGDVMVRLKWAAKYSSTYSRTIALGRWDA